MEALEFARQELRRLRERGLYRAPLHLEGPQGPWVEWEGRRLLQLCSNSYLDLARHPRLVRAAREALERYGCGSGASRLLTGGLGVHRRLEEELAGFFGAEDALLFGSGYLANCGLIPALSGPGCLVLSDELNHASIVDGCRLSRAEVVVYPHGDVEFVERALRDRPPGRRALVVTEGVFSMDGDLAPLGELARVAGRYGALLVVDDAHGIGLLGAGGRGSCEQLGAGLPALLVGTLGKALGCYGAFAVGSHELVELLRNRARSFIFSTALPPPVVAAAREALRLVDEEPWRRHQALRNARYLREGLREAGFAVGGEAAIVPLVVGPEDLTMEMARLARQEGVMVQGVRPPTVPPGTSRLRLTAMATHRREELERAIEVLRWAGRRVGIV